MKTYFRIVTIVLFSGTILSCSSAPVVEPRAEYSMCSASPKKFVWTISSYQPIPKGIALNRVPEVTKLRTAYQEKVFSTFLLSLLYASTNRDQKDQERGLKLPAAMIQTGPANFVLCKNDKCEGLIDPVTKKEIKILGQRGETDSFSRFPIYYVEGVTDPTDWSLDKHRQGDYTGDQWISDMSFDGYHFQTRNGSTVSPYISWSYYLKMNPISAGTFLNDHYFAIPETQKAQLCESAGLNRSCFDDPTESLLNDYCSDGSFSRKFPFTDYFIRNFSIAGEGDICRNYNNFFVRKKFLENLKSDGGHTRMQWENAWAKDLLFRGSFKMSKTAETNWVISRGEWDPTPFCKYAKPKSDLLTH